MTEASFKNNTNNKQEEKAELPKEKPEAIIESEVDKLKKELKESQKKIEEYLNGLKRTQADFINYKNRQSQLMQEWVDMANENLIYQLLSTLDSIETAKVALEKEVVQIKGVQKEKSPASGQWVEGVLKIFEQFCYILRQQGLEEIKSIGEKFNPEIHEAVERVELDKEDGIIIEEVHKGYKLRDKVIRTAKVKVAKKVEK